MPHQCPLPTTGQPEGPPTGPQLQVPMNEAQGPNETIPLDPPTPQAATQVHQGTQVVVSTEMSITFSLGPGWSTSVLDFSDASAVKVYNKPSHCWSSSLMRKQITWLCFWQVSRAIATVSIGPT